MTDPMRARTMPPSAGVTLVELMIVLVIVSIGVLAIAGVQTQSSDAVYETGRETQALSIGQARIESARAAGFAGAQPDSGQLGIFDWNQAVDSVRVGLNQVRLVVGWTESGTRRTIQLATLLSTR